MNDILRKRLMAFAGLVWFVYLIVHMLANLQFFSGSKAFDDFYAWFNNSTITYALITTLLIVTLLFHVWMAVTRQLSNNKKRPIAYEKPYPNGVPRLIAWSGAVLLLSFIVFHSIQMLFLSDGNTESMRAIFSQPLMLFIYALGLVSLAAHLHHALSNVLQTLGKTHHENHYVIIGIVAVLIIGFASVPVSIYLSLC